MDRRHEPTRGRKYARLRLALLIGVFLLALFPSFGTPSVAAPRVSGQIVANEYGESWPAYRGALLRPNGAQISAADAGSTGGETLLYTSDTIDAGQLFDFVGLRWIPARGAEESLYIEARASADGRTWREWMRVREDEDMTDEETNERYAAPMPVEPSRYAQYRVWLTGGDPDALGRVDVTFLDVNDLNAGPVVRLLNDAAGAFKDFTRSYASAAVGASVVRTREDWAADEKLMKWQPKYQRVQKFIVHETVTSDGGTNVAAQIRAIYYFHAVTRGWGDIGYSYLVDKYGNIWTGRQGGDNAIGGHAYGWNDGTIGVAAVGDYTRVAPPQAVIGGIANIIAMKATQFGIQPYGADTFTHQERKPDGSWVDVTSSPPNVIGHRDANYVVGQNGGQTADPGPYLYPALPTMRSLAQNAVNGGYYDMPFLDPQTPKASFPGAVLQVPVAVTNRGKTAIPAGTRVSYRVLKAGVVTQPQGGVGTIAAQLLPGQSATVTVPLTVPATGSYIVRWDLQTGTAWWNATKYTPVRDRWFTSADWSADWVSDNVPTQWTAGETRPISVTVRNDGGRVWPANGTNPVKLGYKWVSSSTGNAFPGANRTSLAADVQPGQTVTLSIAVTAPAYPTGYTMILDLYKENEFAFADKGIAPDDTPAGVSVDFKATYTVGTLPAFAAGTAATVPVTITNTGKGTFPVTNSFPVNLGYHWYTPAGQSVVWDGARTKLPADLAPGQKVTLQARVTAPPAGGQFQLRFDLVQEGVAWFSGKGVATGNVTATVAGPTVRTYGATYAPTVQALAVSGSSTTVPISVTNTGNFTWPAAGTNAIALAYHWVDSAGRTVLWDGLRTKLAADVLPGATVTLQAALRFPTGTGTYTLKWDMVEEGVTWFSGKSVATYDQPVQVGATAVVYYGGSMDVTGTPATLPASITSTYDVKVQNLSNFDFGSNVNLAYHWYDQAGNVVVWDGARTSLAGLKVNEVRTVAVSVSAPSAVGTYTLRYDIVQEGVAWFSSQGMQTPTRSVQVTLPAYGATYGLAASVSGAPGATITVPVTLTNTGSLPWLAGMRINLAYHIWTTAGAAVVWDGVRTTLPANVDRGQSVSVNATVKVPATPGTYRIGFDLVQEGTTWFSGQGVPTGNATLTVQ